MTEKLVKINSGDSLQSFLSRIFQEGIKSSLSQKALDEKEKQLSVKGTDDGGDEEDDESDSLFDDEGGDDADEPSSKTMDDEKDKLGSGDIEPKDIVDRLNSIRSGKSFKDEEVAGAMEEYIGSLSKAEKVALFAFLKGIAQIVTGEVPAEDAEEPSEAPSDVKMQKGAGPEKKKTIKPNVIKKPSGEVKGKKPAEDTSAPITAKRR